MRSLLVSTLGLALAACASVPPLPAPVDSDASARDFSARTLADPGLHEFLLRNARNSSNAPWDFETLCWVSIYFNPTLEVVRAQWSTAQAGEITAASRPNPVIGLVPGYNTNPPIGVSPWLPSVSLDFLFEGKKREKRKTIARAQQEAARFSVLATAWQVRSDLRRALLELQLAEARQLTLGAQIIAQTKVMTLMQARLEAGNLTANELSVPRLALLRAQSSRLEAGSLYALGLAHLSAALGIPVRALTSEHFAPLPQTDFSREALASAQLASLHARADILAALARVVVADSQLTLEISRRFPDVHSAPGYQYDQGANKWTLGISFELPIFNRNEGPIAEAFGRRREAVAAFNAIQAQAINLIDSAAVALDTARVQREGLATLRRETVAQYDRIRSRAENGAADQLEVSNAQMDLALLDATAAEQAILTATATGQLEDALQVPLPHLESILQPHLSPSPDE